MPVNTNRTRTLREVDPLKKLGNMMNACDRAMQLYFSSKDFPEGTSIDSEMCFRTTENFY